MRINYISAMGRSVGFSPASLSGLKIWLAADSLGLANNDPVSTWTDQSGNGFSPTEATNTPTFKTNIVNGNPIVRFDGTNDILNFSGSALGIFNNVASAHLFIVCSDTDNAGADHSPLFFSSGTGAGSTRALIKTKTTGFAVNVHWSFGRRLDADTLASTAMAAAAAGFNVITGEQNWTGNVIQIYRNGVAGTASTYSSGGGNVSATNSLAATIGATGGLVQFFPGDIAEIIIYVPMLSGTNRALVEAYLKTKYATP